MSQKVLILLIPLFTSCFKPNGSETAQINKFESILGEIETKYLNEIVHDFEDYLTSNYSEVEIDSIYKYYLVDLSYNKIKNPWSIDSIKMIKYKMSNLFGKYDTIYPDTVWYEKEMINIKFNGNEIYDYSIVPIRRSNIPLDIDSMITYYKREPNIIQSEPSSFYMALDSIKSSNVFVQSFLNGINQPDWHPYRNLAKGLLNDNPDFSNYFVRRIIAIRTIKNE
jgi:hypothetical protein